MPRKRLSKPLARRSPQEIRQGLLGPVNSIPTTFTPKGDLDWDGIAAMVERGFAGPRAENTVTMLTAGDSQLLFLSDEEVGHLTRFVAQRVNGRGILIGATGRWWVPKAVQFAREARDWGVDILMALPNDQAAQDAVGVEGFYRAIAAVMPTMIVGIPPVRVLERLHDVQAICAFKEDGSTEYALNAATRFGERYAIITGGVLWRYLAQQPYGVKAYMDWLAPLAPSLSARFYAASSSGDVPAMAKFIRDVEMPFQDLAGNEFFGGLSSTGVSSFTGGWQGLWRAALEVNGIAKRYRRAPLPAASDQELAALRHAMAQLNMLEDQTTHP